MFKEKTQLTDFQRKRIIRNDKIVREFDAMTGAITARVDKLATRYGLTYNMIYKIIRAKKQK